MSSVPAGVDMAASGRGGWPAGWLARHEKLAACIASVLLLLAVNRMHGVTLFPFDAAAYWGLSQAGVIGESTTYRGYLWPTLLRPLRLLAELTPQPVPTLGILLAIGYGVLLPLLLPAFFARAFGARLGFWRRLVPVVLLAQLFPGVLIYPLSDLPALLMAIGSAHALLGARDAPSRRTAAAWLVLAGVLAGAAYNTRTIYLFTVAALFLVPLVMRRQHWASGMSRWLAVLALALGLLGVSMPQRMINQHVHGVATFAVMSRVAGQSLFATQLVWGLTLQRYETAVVRGQPLGGIHYLDPAGEQLFRRLAPQRGAFSIGAYLKLVAQRPLEFAALYTRHIVNGLDVRDGLVYVEKPSPQRTRTALFNFLVLALAAWVLVAGIGRTALRPGERAARGTLVLALLLPAAAIVPGAIETRFFLPVHLLAYCVIAFRFDAQALRAAWARWGWGLVAATLLMGAFFFAISTATMGHHGGNWPEHHRLGLPAGAPAAAPR